MARLPDDTARDDGPFLRAAVRLMLTALLVMLLALTSLFFAPITLAPFLSMGLYLVLLGLEIRHGAVSPVTIFMTGFYAVLSASRLFLADIAWSAFAIPLVYWFLAILVLGLLAIGRPFTMTYSRGNGFYPLHRMMSLMWGGLHFLAGTASLVFMPDIAFLLVPLGLMIVGAIGTLVLNFVTMGPRYGRQRAFQIERFHFREARTDADRDLFYATIAEAYRADLQRAAGPRRKISKERIEEEHRASDAKRDGHAVPFLAFDGDRAIGGICMFLDHRTAGLPVEHEANISAAPYRARGHVVEMGRLGIMPRYRLDRVVLTGLFKCVIEAAMDHHVHTILNDSFTWQVKLYGKVGFVPLSDEPYECEDNSTGHGLKAQAMLLDLAKMVRLDQRTTTSAEIREILQPYVTERFFKRLAVAELFQPLLANRWVSRWFRSNGRPVGMDRGSKQRAPGPLRRALRLVRRLWLLGGAAATVYGIVLTTGSPRIDQINTQAAVSSQSDSAGPPGWREAQLKTALVLWSEESGAQGDVFSAGLAAYKIAFVNRDPQWANEAANRLALAREQMPGFTQATAWLGVAHALLARDYPLGGAWQALPGPGLVRIYEVERAKALLDEAVQRDPMDPVVRLVRASALISMPALLVDHNKALDDFALLASWDAFPDLNPVQADVLASTEWRSEFYRLYAEALVKMERRNKAATYWAKLGAISKTPALKEYAEWGMSRLDQ